MAQKMNFGQDLEGLVYQGQEIEKPLHGDIAYLADKRAYLSNLRDIPQPITQFLSSAPIIIAAWRNKLVFACSEQDSNESSIYKVGPDGPKAIATIKKNTTITSLQAFGDLLYIGTTDGVFKFNENGAPVNIAAAANTLYRIAFSMALYNGDVIDSGPGGTYYTEANSYLNGGCYHHMAVHDGVTYGINRHNCIEQILPQAERDPPYPEIDANAKIFSHNGTLYHLLEGKAYKTMMSDNRDSEPVHDFGFPVSSITTVPIWQHREIMHDLGKSLEGGVR